MNITWLDDNQETVVLDVLVSDESYLYEALQGEHALHLVFDTAEYTEIPLGAQCLFNGEYYTLQVPATIEKQHSTSYRVTAVFESTQYSLKKYTVKEVRWNSTTSTWDTARTGTMRFNFTATAREHLQLIVDNLNKREGTGVWSIAQSGCIETSEKLVSYDYTNVADALNTIAETFDTEWYITGHTIALKKVEHDKTDPLALSYGRGNGFKSGVGRTNAGDVMPVEVLNVQGTDRNIDFSKYNAKNLLLPKSLTFLYDDADAFSFDSGTTWKRYDEETNTWLTILDYTPTNAQSYVTTDDGLSVMIPTSLQKTKQESNFDGTDIYPSRVCTVTSVETTTQSNQTLYDIIDSTIPSDLNFASCVIAGETPSITFQTGMLAGRNFQFDAETGYVHASRKFKIVNEEIDGMIMPEPTAYYPQVGDKFVVFGIQLPAAYVCNDSTRTGASYDMLREAVANLHENRKAKYTFSGELDGIYSRQNWANIGTKIRIGEYISFTDDAFQTDPVLIRIVGIKTFVNSPYSPEIEMSNESSGSTVISELKKLKAQEVVTEDLHRDAIRQSKRDFAAAKATTDALGVIVANLENELGNFTEGISPITVETMQLLVGSPNLQFAFGSVTSGQFTKQQTSIYFENGKLNISFTGSYLLHYTLGLEKVMSTTANKAAMKVWKMNNAWQSGTLADGSKSYYVYAKVSRSAAGTLASLPTSTQAYELSETPLGMESAQNYYYLLIGFLNAEVDGERSFAPMYGYTEILPSQVSTDKIVSSDGTGVIIDLVNGTITGNITFNAATQQSINGLINNNSNVISAGSTAQQALTTANDGGLWKNRLFQLATPTIGAASSETAPFGTARLLASRDHQATESSAIPLIAGHTYHFVIEFYARRLSGSASLNCGVWTNNEGTMWYYGASTKVSDYDANWAFYRRSFAFTTPSGATTARLFFQIDQAYSGGDTQWLICDVQWYDADNDLAQTTANSALSNASSAQSAAQQAQQDASTAKTAVDNMNGDNIFSVVEKKAFRPEWKNIQGLNDTTSTPTASTTNGGSYEKALIAANGITDSTITADVSALTTAYSTLKTFLNTYALYTSSNTNWGSTGQSTLGSNTKAYYDAETKLYNDLSDYYMRQVELGGANLMRTHLKFRTTMLYRIIGNGIYQKADTSTTDSRSWGYAYAQHQIALPKGTFTVSIYNDEADSSSWAQWRVYVGETMVGYGGVATVGRHSCSFTTSSASNNIYIEVKTIVPYRIKIEVGNKPTDWALAPEDEATGNGTNLLIGTNGATVDITQTSGGSYQQKQPFTSSKVIGTATSEMWVTLQFKVDNWTNNFSPVNSVVIGKAFDYSDGWSRRISFAPSSVGSLGGSASGVENYDKFIQINSTTRLYWASVKVRKGDNINQTKPIFVCCQNNGTSSTAYTCSLYDVKMEVGSSPTEYTIAPEDVTQEMIDEANAVRREQSYLNAAYKSNTDIKGGLILSSLIQVRNPNSESDDDVKAGMNGVVRDGAEDVRFWAGGTLAKAAQTLASTNGTLTENNSVPFVVLHDGTVILSKAIIDAIGAANKLRFENGKIVFYNGTTKKTELVADTKASVDAMLEDMQSSKDSNQTLTFSARSATNFSQVSQTNATAASSNAPSYTLSQSASYNGNSGTAFTAVGDELATIASAATLAITINASDIQFVPNVSGQNAAATIIKVVNRATLYLNGNNNTSFVVGTATVETTALTAQTVNVSLSSGAVVGNLTKGVTYTPQLIISRSVTAKFTTTNVSVAQGTINLTGSHQYSQLAPVLTFTAAGYVNKMYGNGLAMAGYSDLFFAFNSSVYERCLHIRSGVGETAYRKNYGLVHREKASGAWSLVSPIFMTLDVTTQNGNNGSVSVKTNNRGYSVASTAYYVSSSYSNTKGIWRISIHNKQIELFFCFPTAFGSAFYCSVISQGYNSTYGTYVDIRCTVDHDNYSQHPSGTPFRFRIMFVDVDEWQSNLPT